ncbi:MAG: hypothetical protein Q9219_006415 [cf. Caloplaca sp. 3 TL-2023]
MAVSASKDQYRSDHRRWVWKLVLRAVAVVVTLVGMGCVAWILYKLRQWANSNEEGNYKADDFILPWMLFSLTLSLLYNIANILIALSHHPNFFTPTATITCDCLITVSLLASGIWLSLAATTAIDGNNALDIHFYPRQSSYAYSLTIKSAIEIIGIGLTFLDAILHTIFFLSACLSRYRRPPHRSSHAHKHTYNITKLPSHSFDLQGTSTKPHPADPIHPAYRSPLPYPNPNHPTCAYSNLPHPAPPALRYQYQASPTGVHAQERKLSEGSGSGDVKEGIEVGR